MEVLEGPLIVPELEQRLEGVRKGLGGGVPARCGESGCGPGEGVLRRGRDSAQSSPPGKRMAEWDDGAQ